MSKSLARLSLLALAGLLLTGAAFAQETVTTEIRNGEVVSVYGNHLVVRTAGSADAVNGKILSKQPDLRAW